MSGELLLPFAKWGAILLFVSGAAFGLVKLIKKSGYTESERDRSQGVGDALSEFQREEQKARDEAENLPRSAVAAKLRKLARRRRRS